MLKRVLLVKISDDAEYVDYVEQTGPFENASVIGELRLSKAFLPTPAPETISLCLSTEPVEKPYSTSITAAAQVRVESTAMTFDLRSASVAVGDLVRVIKNRQSGTKMPPEWLGQYLGKTGVVVRATPKGGIVEIDGNATWFSNDELEPLNQVD